MNLKCAELEVKNIRYRVTSNPKSKLIINLYKIKTTQIQKNNTDRDSRAEQFDLSYDEIYLKRFVLTKNLGTMTRRVEASLK